MIILYLEKPVTNSCFNESNCVWFSMMQLLNLLLKLVLRQFYSLGQRVLISYSYQIIHGLYTLFTNEEHDKSMFLSIRCRSFLSQATQVMTFWGVFMVLVLICKT